MPPDVGMSGGGKLDLYMRRIAESAGPPQQVQIGFLAGATYPDGTSVAMVAAIQEFGAPSRGIPPRPFFRSMITAHQGEWGDQLGKVLVAKDYNGSAALGLMGELIAGELRESIIDFVGAPLAAATVKAKGSEKALVDTGHMLQSIDYEVTGS